MQCFNSEVALCKIDIEVATVRVHWKSMEDSKKYEFVSNVSTFI